jgi:hypothetical protein
MVFFRVIFPIPLRPFHDKVIFVVIIWQSAQSFRFGMKFFFLIPSNIDLAATVAPSYDCLWLRMAHEALALLELVGTTEAPRAHLCIRI